MLEPLAATVFNSLLSARPFAAHSSTSHSAFRMVTRATASSFPQDFFTPRPRRVKGKERAHSEDVSTSCRVLPTAPGDPGPSVPFSVRHTHPSILRDATSCRHRARRIPGQKLIHASSRRDVPSFRSWLRQANVAQRRHASSLPELLDASATLPSAWQRDLWRNLVLDFTSDSTSQGADEAWDAFDNLQRCGDCDSLQVSQLLGFVSRITSFAESSLSDTSSPQSPRLWGAQIHAALDAWSPRIRDTPLDVDHLHWRCLTIRALALMGEIEEAVSEARETSKLPMDTSQRTHIVEMYTTILLSVRRDRNAVSTSEFLMEEWNAVESYLRQRFSIWHHPPLLHAVKAFHQTASDIVVSMENPAAFMLATQKRWPDVLRRSAAEFLVEALCRADFAEDAHRVLQTMQQQSLALNLETQLDVVKALVKADSFMTANSLFASLSRSASGAMFRLYQSAGLYLFAHQGDVQRSEDHFERLLQRGWVRITDITMILHVHALRGDTARVVELFHHFFPEAGADSEARKPNIFHFTTVIFAYAQRGDLDAMNMWLEAMKQAGISPDIYVYNVVLHTFAMRGEMESMVTLMNQMRSAGVQPTAPCYTTIFTAFAQRKDAIAAEELYKRSQEEGVVPDRRMITALMNVYIETGQWQGVIRVFDYLSSSRRRGLQLSIEVFNTLLKAYVLIGAPFRVVASLFQKLEEAKVRPDQYTYALLIQSACDSGLMQIATDIFAEMEKLADDWQSSFHINTYVLTIIMAGYLRKGFRKRARAIFDSMKARGVEPTAVTYGVIVRAYSVSRNDAGIEVAEDFVKSLMATEPDHRRWMKPVGGRGLPLEFLYAPLMVAHSWAHRTEDVERLFQDMLANGGEPTLGTLTALLDVYRRTGNVEAARLIWPQILELGLRHSQINSLFQDEDSGAKGGLRSHGIALCIPLSIYIDVLSATGHHSEIAAAWTALRSQSMAFDSHNWNHLCVALVRAGEPLRAFEVIENVILPYRRKTQVISPQRDRVPESPLTSPLDLEELQHELPPSPSESPLHFRGRRSPHVAIATKRFKPGMETGKQDDFAHALHILSQVSPIWNVWRPHGTTLRVLQDVLKHLEAGRVVQPVGLGGEDHTRHVLDMESLTKQAREAGEILARIYDSCLETVHLVRDFDALQRAQRQKIIYRRSR